MECLAKCLCFSALIAVTYGRYVLQERINETSNVCIYQNKDYKVGSKIITCQVCRCRDGIPPQISCVTYECPALAAPKGNSCHLVYRENKCCPTHYECNANCSCDWRYFKHYEIKGCLVETEDSCGCPQKFSCPSNQTQEAPAKVCIYQNKEYKVGSKIITSNVCQVCRCRDGIPPQISCVTYECPAPAAPKGNSCHLVYRENKCCPTHYECIENALEDSVEINRIETCEYNGQLYPLGSKIYPEDDPCQICICNENWNGVDNSSCTEHDCTFEKNKSKLDAGCIPVYHESRCCPVEFYCPSSHNLTNSNPFNNESSKSYNSSEDYHCIFADESYELGEELAIGNPCVKCTCVVPPDFTCVHQTCPPPPNQEDCSPIYNSGDCCPSYDCMLGDGLEHVPDGCPTPMCADSSCRIEIPAGHECPTCICQENISELEHNNLEQVQQISQNIENMEQAFEFVEGSDNSEDELQMMPLRVEDSEGQVPILEKMIMSEEGNIYQYPEGLRELEESSNEDNSSIEAVYNVSKELILPERRNSTYLTESEFHDTYLESFSNDSDKGVQKRSERHGSVFPVEQKESSQEAMQEINEDIEREGVEIDDTGEDFDDELENFKYKLLSKNGTIINEIFTIDHTVKVPPGCPTPLCEGPWCIIGIPEGHRCPTCICKRPIDNEP